MHQNSVILWNSVPFYESKIFFEMITSDNKDYSHVVYNFIFNNTFV